MENYGNGESTGLDQTAAGKIVTGLVRDDLAMTPQDREVLRGLAERVAAIADQPRMHETRRLWTRHNGLEETRPLVFCDPENGWNEIITESQMQCRGKLARRWEMDLRKEIFWGEEMGDDKPVEPYFDVPYTVPPDDWGLEAEYHRTDAAGSCVWDAPIKDYDTDLQKLHSPAGRNRLGDDQRLSADRRGRVRRHSHRPAEGDLVVVAGAHLAGRHAARARATSSATSSTIPTN